MFWSRMHRKYPQLRPRVNLTLTVRSVTEQSWYLLLIGDFALTFDSPGRILGSRRLLKWLIGWGG